MKWVIWLLHVHDKLRWEGWNKENIMEVEASHWYPHILLFSTVKKHHAFFFLVQEFLRRQLAINTRNSSISKSIRLFLHCRFYFGRRKGDKNMFALNSNEMHIPNLCFIVRIVVTNNAHTSEMQNASTNVIWQNYSRIFMVSSFKIY